MHVLIAARPHVRYDIRFAASKGVLMTTCDSIIELDKIAKWHPNAQCVLTTTPRSALHASAHHDAPLCAIRTRSACSPRRPARRCM